MKHLPFAFLLLVLASCRDQTPPAPFGALPSERQMDWHEMEYYAFVHFNMNTFSDMEWGYGNESPEQFNPSALDCRQWARIARDAGMKGIILTAKHHDGFSLWPSAYTEHSVKNSPWRDGQGDVVRELADACREYGLKMGVYLSPWDRNHPDYGKPEYLDYFRNQLRELLTNYGDIFEVWFDGANGGNGYYGGANETRNVDRQSYYDWPTTIELVRELQPEAVIFSDAGPDVRWVGTERGFALPTNWATLNRDSLYPGSPRYLELRSGHRNGTHWVPAEVDVSIRPGWYYHQSQDDQVKSADHLELIYYNSVGRNASLLINLPVDRRGLVHPNDSAALIALRQRLDATFSNNHAIGATVSASSTHSSGFAAGRLTDGIDSTFWAAAKGTTNATLEVDLDGSQTFNVVELQEFIPLGQRIESVAVDAYLDGQWEEIGRATTVGYKRWIRVPSTTTSRLRLRIEKAMAPPLLSGLGLYQRPHANYLLESDQAFDERMAWWRDAKFGMFIHWGAYAVPAGIHRGKEISGAAEWIMYSGNIPVAEYEPYARRFNPTQYDAEAWVKLAKAAGMQYIVITSKHHDGFCLWDSKVSNYDVIDFAAFGRDALKELADACRKEGIRLGFYHSIMDWHHPDAKGERFPRYRDEYLKPQLRELIENYQPEILWFDGEWIDEWTEPQGKDLYQYVRSLRPSILINNRVGKGRSGMQGMNREPEYVGDFGTPEQEILDHGSGDADWESCMTMNNSWGFKQNDHDWKSTETLIHNLVDIVAKGGNYLLNVGPDARGLIPEASVERLLAMGEWMQVNSEALYGAGMWDVYAEGDDVRYIRGADGSLYVLALRWPGEQLRLRHVRPAPGSPITMLGDGQPLDWSFDEREGLTIKLPAGLESKGRYAWVFKMQASHPVVTAAPVFYRANDQQAVDKNFDIFAESVMVSLHSDDPEARIYYTLDGSEPTTASQQYSGPIQLDQTTLVKAMATSGGQVNSPVARAEFRKSRFNGISLTHPYAEKYNAGGPLGLLDGSRGSTDFHDGQWQGFEGVDFEAVVDLGSSRDVHRLEVAFLQDLGAWIFPPTRVRFALSEDGKNWQPAGEESIPTPREQQGPKIWTISSEIAGGQARFVRIEAKNIGVCPSWHAGAGGKAWVFVDEVEVE